MERTGEIAALATALCWTVSALVFENVSNKIGSLSVNFIRMLLAIVFISIFSKITRGIAFPVDANLHQVLWLTLSGIVGFVIGDFMLFKSYTIIGSRVAMLIMTLVPPITATIGWIFLNEVLTLLQILGIFITMFGIASVIWIRNSKQNKTNLKTSGLLLAFGAAICQSVGLILSKYGMKDYNAFSATQIRIITAIIGFGMLVPIFNANHKVIEGFTHTKTFILLCVGACFGPFLGVSLSLYAVQHANSGVVSTIMSIVPILMVPPAIFILKQKVTWLEFVGICISVAGVSLLFI